VANVVIPSLSVFEKEGSFVNVSFRLQTFKAAVPGPSGILPDYQVLEKVLAPLSDSKAAVVNLDLLWSKIAESNSAFKGLAWRQIPTDGIALDAHPYLDLPFVETKNLKFDPVAFKEAYTAGAEA